MSGDTYSSDTVYKYRGSGIVSENELGSVAPNFSEYARNRSSSVSSLIQKVIFVVLLPIVLIGLQAGNIISTAINRLRGKNAVAKSLSEQQIGELIEKANGGDREAQFCLGQHHAERSDVIPEHKEAVKWYRMAAQQGHVEAQFSLGGLYEGGYGDARDYEEAAKWYRMAGSDGHVQAQFDLGLLYEEGRLGSARKYEQAANWYRKAALEGDWQAQFQLGKLFAEGNGVEQDEVQALMWCELALEFNLMSPPDVFDDPYYIEIERMVDELNSPLKKALLTGFHSTAKHNATKAVSPSSETMRTI